MVVSFQPQPPAPSPQPEPPIPGPRSPIPSCGIVPSVSGGHTMARASALFGAFVVAALSFHGVSSAQTPAPAAAKPGPEHERLGYFVGKWTTEGEIKPSPMGPGGKMTSTDTCEWFDGHFSVVCHSTGKSPAGPSKSVG